MPIQCGTRIEVEGTGGRVCTYCMRPIGHAKYDPKGKHETVMQPIDKENEKCESSLKLRLDGSAQSSCVS